MKLTTSPVFGWFVAIATTSPRGTSTSSTNPASAFFGPTSTNTRAPCAYSVSSPFTNSTGAATCLASKSMISSRAPACIG